MNKQTRILIVVAVAAVAAYLLYRYISNRGGENSGTGSLGTNLNSVAPELIGGSSGPTQGPAVDVPVNITLTTSDVSNEASHWTPANNQTTAAVQGLNTPANHASTPGVTASPLQSPAMQSASGHNSPMTSQHRAAKHSAVTSQAQANMDTSEAGGTKPRVPSPSSHASHHSSHAADKTTARKRATTGKDRK